jgi:uncharacterized metal-binding protein YceD (DUF177 family)
MDYLSKYEVIFSGLSVGKHNFNFEIDDKFFEHFDYSEIKRGSLVAKVELNRMNAQIVAKFVITGSVVTICDRCLDDVMINIDYDNTLLIKYTEQVNNSENDYDDDDEIMYINRGNDKINFAQYIYESICISLPIQKIHASESQCNADMIKKLKEMTVN